MLFARVDIGVTDFPTNTDKYRAEKEAGAAAREAVPAIDCGHGRKIPCLKLIKAGQSHSEMSTF